MQNQSTLSRQEVAVSSGNEAYREQRPRGMVGRFFETTAQLSGLMYGGTYAYVREGKMQGRASSLRLLFLRLYLFLGWPFVDRELAQQPFGVQFRVRLERMGPAYVKLGQILSLREDILPKSLTYELKDLLSELPAVPYERVKQLIEADLHRSTDEVFSWVGPVPLGTASLAQSHRAYLMNGDEVVVKVLKPGVRESIKTDTRLLRLLGGWLELFLPRYQPAKLVREFSTYTLREVDLRNEADNAEIFAANFRDEPRVRFPRVYREFSNRDVLCMEYFDGRMPNAETVARLTEAQKNEIVDLGVGAIVKMIFRDGFFHADLHPGNLLIFDDATVGFIDLGMVGRFEADMQKRMLYYFHSLAQGDAARAARYLTAMAEAGNGSDAHGFRRAVEGLNLRWLRSPTFNEFSLGQLVLESIALAGKYRIRYPGEVILMVKALITVEGVGNQVKPGINVTQVSSKHVRRLLTRQFNLETIFNDTLLVVPELLDVLQRAPLVLDEGLRQMESRFKTRPQGVLEANGGILFAIGLMISAAIMAVGDLPWPLWSGMMLLAFAIAGIDRLRK